MAPLFHRSSAHDAAGEGIDRFWAWWGTARPRIEEEVASKTIVAVVDEIARHVHDIDPHLAWEVGPGITAQYQFCLSAEGDIERRAVTERWLRHAPDADGRWEFHAAKQATVASGAWAIDLSGVLLTLADLRFWTEVDTGRERIDVTAWHPRFAELDEKVRAHLGFLALDGLIGEDEVTRWVGVIASPSEQPANGQPKDADGLRQEVAALAATATGNRFVLGEATSRKGRPMIVAVNGALKHIDHLDKPVRLRVSLSLLHPDPNGFPGREEGDALSSYEDRLSAAIPHSVYAGRVTGEGRRTWNWYVGDASEAAAAARHMEKPEHWHVDVAADPDPRWEGLSRNLLDVS